MSRRAVSFYRNGGAALAADVALVAGAQEADRQARRALAAERRRAEDAEPAVDPSTLPGAVAVRVRRSGWRLVDRVNRSTVSVVVDVNPSTGARATMRVPLRDVLEVRR